MKILEDFIETSAKMADQVAKVAGGYIDKGKDKITVLSLENELAKAQRQLGALVYVLNKTNETNDDLFNQYIEDVAKIEMQILVLKEENDRNTQNDSYSPSKENIYCHSCGNEVGGCDVFCRSCGCKVSG